MPLLAAKAGPHRGQRGRLGDPVRPVQGGMRLDERFEGIQLDQAVIAFRLGLGHRQRVVSRRLRQHIRPARVGQGVGLGRCVGVFQTLHGSVARRDFGPLPVGQGSSLPSELVKCRKMGQANCGQSNHARGCDNGIPRDAFERTQAIWLVG